jgi:hypothetical protein
VSKAQTLLTLAAISSIRWPTAHRSYLFNLLKQIVEFEDAKFIAVLGDIIDGTYLENELRQIIKSVGKNKKDGSRVSAEEIRKNFIFEAAREFSKLLPVIEGRKYHFIVAQRVFEKEIGVEILEAVRRLRSDMRILGEREGNKEYDTEVKIPVETSEFEEIRGIVPRRKPWFYRIITSFMQRLINSYISRTSSPPPNLILVGATGTQAFIPFACDGVPAISVPAFHKLDEQISTENMVGVVIVKVLKEDGRIRLVQRTYNLKPIIAQELELICIGEKTTKVQKLIIEALRKSPASLGTITFRVNDIVRRSKNGKLYSEEEINSALKELQEKRIVVYRAYSNWFALNDKKLNIQVNLADLLKDTKCISHFIISCVHTGAVKSLQETFLWYVPEKAWNVDAFFEVGDHTQDLAHNLEYSGEVYPSLLTPDKQEIMAGAIRARVLLKIFEKRIKELIKDVYRTPVEEVLRKALVPYVFTVGNHPSWKKYRKGTLVLHDFESELKKQLVNGIVEILSKYGRKIDLKVVNEVVDEKIIRVGENNIAILDGIVVGVKHPFKASTQSKSQRIQDVINFLWRTFGDLAEKTSRLKENKGFSLVYVANFHEMASVFVSKFGKTVLGVMSGAYVKDTQFETSKDKAVDYGFAMVNACISPSGDLIRADVEFDNYILPEEAKFVFSDRIFTSQILEREIKLTKILDIPWR